MNPDATLEAVDSGPAGLDEAEAAGRLVRHGRNELVEKGATGPLRLLWEQLTAVMVLILVVNLTAAVGAFAFGIAQVYFFVVVVLPCLRGKGEKAAQNPWEGAEGLEWEVPSPAPFHTFETPPKLNASATKVVG